MRAYSKRLLVPALLGAAVAAWTAQPLARADEDLVLGTWTLNVAKSRWTPGPSPRSQTRIYEAHPDGLKATIKTVYADGHSTSVEYVAQYDSIEYPLTGSPDAEKIALKRIDAYTAEATLGHAGKVIGTARRVISRDGKTMTITYRGELEGRTVNNVSVYERQ
jgi:hypothetical protein